MTVNGVMCNMYEFPPVKIPQFGMVIIESHQSIMSEDITGIGYGLILKWKILLQYTIENYFKFYM